MKKFLMFLSLLLLTGTLVMAQAKIITGTVTSSVESEGPIPGVSVVAQGTTIGTLTDMGGKYSINVPPNVRTLIFTFVGMKTQEVVIGNQTVINIVMNQDLLNLDEVIVTGVAAGTPKKKMAVSVERVGENQLKEVYAGSASSALQGKVSGLTVINSTGEPGSAATILVRGATQISGSQNPLIILDGAIMEGTLADINVDDIEAIEVVKGASASALYGSRAGNGVIAVTTRRGNLLGEGKTEVIVRNEYGINRLAKHYDLATHHYYKLAAGQSGNYTQYEGVTYPSGYPGYGSVEGSRSAETDQYLDNPYARLFNHESDVFTGSGYYTNYVSVGSNMGKTNFLVSFENNRQGGLLVETDGYKRNSFRLNVDHKLSPKLFLSASNLYVKSATQDPGGADYYNGGIFFNTLLLEPDVDLNAPNPDGQPYLFIPNNWQDEQENPIYELWKIQDLNTRNRILGTYLGRYNLTNFLNFEAKYAFEYSLSQSTTYNPYDTYVRAGSGPVYSQGSLYKGNSADFSRNFQVTANFNKKLGDFNTRAKLSYLFEKESYESNSTTAQDFSVSGIPSFDAIVGNKSITSYKDAIIAKNYFAIMYIDFRDKYIFDGMFRYDGSSLFGSEARWNPYYRVSAAYRLTEDISIPGIQEFKLRGAYGTAGQRPSFADQYEVMRISSGTVEKAQLGNKLLKPSLSKEWEAGLNIDFLQRFSFELIHSVTNTTDQILNVPLPVQVGGWPSQVQNAGTLNSKVWEASLNAQVVRKSNVTYNIGFIFDRVRTKITELNVPPFQTGPQGQEAYKAFYIREGEVFGAMYGYAFVRSLEELALQLPGTDNISNYELNSDGYVIPKGTAGKPTEVPVKKFDENGSLWFGKIGDSNPKFKMSMRNNFNFRGIGIYALLELKNGGDVYNKSAQWLTRDDRHGMMDQFGKPDNEKKTLTYYKTFYDANNQIDFWVEDASYFKLREVSLSYSLPPAALQNFINGSIKGIKFSILGKNLITISNYSGYDPEVQTTNNTQYFAYDFMGYPNYRSFAASLEVKF